MERIIPWGGKEIESLLRGVDLFLFSSTVASEEIDFYMIDVREFIDRIKRVQKKEGQRHREGRGTFSRSRLPH